ncbi:helix-turn-helix domain-containing protein [Asticcacaulis tiandongensis]|uniref:helix-turn-helix domain-containing protein n=1 Tax=Asticcacaulis tiandongensis TaxID=2565365 RepID=UPI00112AC88F|nr:helix-turn-helix transcriptional regulator [Asticcacaulis tiandongensis]
MNKDVTAAKKRYSREDVSRRLISVRHRISGTSQIAFALALDVPRRTIQNYEQGRSDISAEFLIRLFDRFGVDPLWLLLGEGDTSLSGHHSSSLDMFAKVTAAVTRAIQNRQLQVSPEKTAALVAAVYKKVRIAQSSNIQAEADEFVELAS